MRRRVRERDVLHGHIHRPLHGTVQTWRYILVLQLQALDASLCLVQVSMMSASKTDCLVNNNPDALDNAVSS